MSDRYLIISADCHAGLPNAQYREWLDPSVHEAFDAALTARKKQQEAAMQGFLNEEFAEEWKAENEEGLRGSWDAERRDKELDADGVAGEVIFPDGDSVTGGASAPFGAGLGTECGHAPRTRARRCPGPQPVAGRALRHQPRTPTWHRARCPSPFSTSRPR